jgi:hypothetical protein
LIETFVETPSCAPISRNTIDAHRSAPLVLAVAFARRDSPPPGAPRQPADNSAVRGDMRENACVRPEDVLPRAQAAFFRYVEQQHRLPYDLSTPKYDRGEPLKPIDCLDCQVAYPEGVAEIEQLRIQDPSLNLLRRLLSFRFADGFVTLEVGLRRDRG